MLKKIALILSITLFYMSCETGPETKPETAPAEIEETQETEEPVVPEEQPEEEPVIEVEDIPEEKPVEPEVPEEPAPEPVSEEAIKEARMALFKAEEAQAERFFPERLGQLKKDLVYALSFQSDDPDKCRELLAGVTTTGADLRTDSLAALRDICLDIMAKKTKALINLEADKYSSQEFMLTQELRKEAVYTFNNGTLSDSVVAYRQALTAMTNLETTLKKNKDYISRLLRDINRFYQEGLEKDTMNWARTESEAAQLSYNQAMDLLYNQYDAKGSEAQLRETIYLIKKAIKQGEINKEVARTDKKILELLEGLEEASTLTVVDNEDNIIPPSSWNGDEALEKAPLMKQPIEADIERDDESEFEEVDLDRDVEIEIPEVSVKITTDGNTAVLGDVQEKKDLLSLAKEYWAKGIEERNNGNLEKADEYLKQAEIYMEEYKSMAVSNVYTVVLNPEDRDCLWKIAGREEFYNDPFKWTLIWERNKKLIQDPDLIYPGWQLIIPPAE